MARTLSAAMVRAMADESTSDGAVILVTLDGPSWPSPVRITSELVEVVSRGVTFQPCPFEFTFPSDQQDQPATATLTVDNIGRELVDEIRTAVEPLTVKIEVVRLLDHDSVEATWPEMEMTAIDYDVSRVTGGLAYRDDDRTEYPAQDFVPSVAPGLF